MPRRLERPGDHQVLFSQLREVLADVTLADWLAVVSEVAPAAGFLRAGSCIRGRCPFHADRAALLVLMPTQAMARCFGCHRVWFNLVRLVAELRNASAPSIADTLLVLRRRLGLRGITEQLQERLREHEILQRLKNRLCRFFCEEMLEAIAAYPMQASPDYSWAGPAVEDLMGRRLGEDAPGDVAADLDDEDGGATGADPHGLWPAITSNQLVGVFPPEVRVIGRFGADSEEHRFFRHYFGFLAATGFGVQGYLVFPLHDEPGSVCRFKLRAPSSDAESFFVDDAFEPEMGGFRGFYGLHYFRGLLGPKSSDDASCGDTVVVMDGELDALASMAHQVRRQSHPFIALAVAGARVPVLERLKVYGVEQARVVGGGDGSLVDRVSAAAPPSDGVVVSRFEWPEEYVTWRDPTDPERRIHGPEDAVRWLGHARWASHVMSGERYRPLPAPRREIARRGRDRAGLQLPLFEDGAPEAAAKAECAS